MGIYRYPILASAPDTPHNSLRAGHRHRSSLKKSIHIYIYIVSSPGWASTAAPSWPAPLTPPITPPAAALGEGTGFMIYDSWLMVYGVWLMVYGLWLMVDGLWFMVYDLGVWGLVFWVQVLESRV